MKEVVVWGLNGEWIAEIRASFQGPKLWVSVPLKTDVEAAKMAEDEFRRLYPNETHFGPIMSGHIG